MGKNVIARQSGDDYQAKFFWLKACGLNYSHSKVARVAWELNSNFGFDDVVVYYEPAILESGSEVTEEYYQVKFHVDHAKGFTCIALTEPEFIGAKKESLLQRLYNIYKQNPENFHKARYYIVNTWGIDHSDDIRVLIGNNGGIRLDTLFQGGESSKFGKIRKLWKDHLQITSDDVLRLILSPLRIKHSFDDEQRLMENLNVYLDLAGLKPIPADQRSSKYIDLIQKLHKDGKNILTKEDLLDICSREDLLHKKERASNDSFIIGIRSFQKGAESLQLEVHTLLCLLHCFSNRFILEEYSWNDHISKQIKALAETAIHTRKPLIIHLDTHLSIALYLGYCLNVKYGGLNVTIIQKTFNGKVLWKPEQEKINEYMEPQWAYEIKQFSENGIDIALSLSVTHDIRLNVEDYISLLVFTSMRTVDNLSESTSSFSAELKRLKQLLDILKSRDKRILFLLDEILKGTNSADRHTGSQALIRQLSKSTSMGLVSTHDLNLISLADELKLVNYSFNSELINDKIIFDYKLTAGPCHTANATVLMRQMGIGV